jgi:3-oxoadipate enol-lactonase
MNAIINGIRVEYSVHGETGPWLIMSHSLGCTQAMWEAQIAAFSGDYRIVCYDTRGHGNTEATSGPYTLDLLADDALGLLDHLAIDRVIWVGFSMGGMIGQTFALKYPQRLTAIVLADTTSRHTTTPVAMWNERIRVAQEQGMEPLVAPAINRWFTESFRTAQPAVVAHVADMIRTTSVAGWAGCCAAISAVNTTERLHEITCPALVLVGELDVGTPLAAALDIHRHLPQSTLVVISDAAHMTDVEQPEQFNRALAMFLGATTAA